jgi:hypothetical protein
MEGLRVPFLVVALVLALFVLCGELGAAWLLTGASASRAQLALAVDEQMRHDPDLDRDELLAGMLARQRGDKPPGLAIPALAFVDGLLVLTLGLLLLAVVVPERVHGRVQGLVSLVVSFFVLLAALGAALWAFGKLLLMVTLFLSVPFGTLAYIATWGFFDTSGATAVLALAGLFKLVALVCLPLAHQRFLKVKGLLFLMLTSLLLGFVTSFLHALPPGILVSITDAVAALINAIVGLVWALFFVIAGLIAVVKMLRVDRL